MKIVVLLYVWILLIFGAGGASFYFVDAFFTSNNIKSGLENQIESENSTLNKNKNEIVRLQDLKNKLDKYLNSKDYVPPIKDYRSFLKLEKKLQEFSELNELNVIFKFDSSKNIDKTKMFFPLNIKTQYNNVKEIDKFVSYLAKTNKTKIKNIIFNSRNNELHINVEILSEKF